MLYCTGRTRSPSESLACVSASISYGPGSRDLKVLSKGSDPVENMYDSTPNNFKRKGTARWQQCSRARAKT